MMTTADNTAINTQFLKETLQGLNADPKYMLSKYFYDEKGDYIFQQIMNMDEYYLTNSEMEIMREQANEITETISMVDRPFDLIELGAGDATKSIHLLKMLLHKNLEFKYFPIDISEHVIADLAVKLPAALPTLKFEGLNGDYFDMLKEATKISGRRKVVLFMGANIGNMSRANARQFCIELKKTLSPQDILIIGFDLKKNPKQILAAYNDQTGITRSFNLNLLNRINNELNGNFDLSSFDHYANYSPESGECKSYLISLKEQTVNIGDATIQFSKDEYIFMEISQKYALEDIEDLASQTGFKVIKNFTDQQHYFVDAVWKVV